MIIASSRKSSPHYKGSGSGQLSVGFGYNGSVSDNPGRVMALSNKQGSRLNYCDNLPTLCKTLDYRGVFKKATGYFSLIKCQSRDFDAENAHPSVMLIP